jgi:polysaccharide chain length determinant protein (PEP-CTERM system associated)
MYEQEGIQLGDIGGMLRRRAGLTGAVAGVVFLLSVVLAAVLPNEYEAWTTLLVEPQAISRKLVESGVEGSDLNSRLHLITMQILSRGRLSHLIDDLGLYPEESKEMTREEVISLMREHIWVEPVLPELATEESRPQEIEINTFRLFYRTDAGGKVATVANRLANEFIDEHIRERVEVSGSTSEFLDAELERVRSQIQEVEARIASVKNENQGRLPEDLTANQSMLERVLMDMRLSQRDVALAESDEAFFRQQAITGASDGPRAFTAADSPAERRQRLQLQLGEYVSRGLTDKHPDVVAAKEELVLVEERLADSSEQEGASPTQQNASNEAERAAIRAKAARGEVERLTRQIEDLEARIAATPRVQEQLAGLEREHRHLYASYQEFSGKQLEANVAANMERRQKGEQFRILEAAFPPSEPVSPNRLLILVVGLMLGLASGGGAALLAESVDTSFHRARDLQREVQIPVLASIPRVLFQSDRARLRRARIVKASLALALSGIILFGAGVGYWIVNGPPFGLQKLLGEEAPAPAAGAGAGAPAQQG